MRRKKGSSSLGILVLIAVVVVAALLLLNSKYSPFGPKAPSAPKATGLPTYGEKFSKEKVRLITINDGPWAHPLLLSQSKDGNVFAKGTAVEQGAEAPSVVKDANGKLYVVFQWFPKDKPENFDTIGVKTSTDDGLSWSPAQSVTIENYPSNYERPFNPAVAMLSDGRLRLYFTSRPQGNGMPSIYSAVSGDGIHYVFEDGVRLMLDSAYAIDPAVIMIGNMWHMYGPKEGIDQFAYHATSSDGMSFTTQKDIDALDTSLWVGNAIAYDNGVRFYGGSASDSGIFWSYSSDGSSWTKPTFISLLGKDPAVVKVSDTKYLLFYTDAFKRSSQIITVPSPTPKK